MSQEKSNYVSPTKCGISVLCCLVCVAMSFYVFYCFEESDSECIKENRDTIRQLQIEYVDSIPIGNVTEISRLYFAIDHEQHVVCEKNYSYLVAYVGFMFLFWKSLP